MRKVQMHFEVDHELKAHWKAFFATMPRRSETKVLTQLVREFLEKAKTEYRLEAAENNSLREDPNDTGTDGVDQSGNRTRVDVEGGVAGSGSDIKHTDSGEDTGK